MYHRYQDTRSSPTSPFQRLNTEESRVEEAEEEDQAASCLRVRRFPDRLLGAHGTDATTAAAATTLGVRSPKVRPKVMLGIVSVKRESFFPSLWSR